MIVNIIRTPAVELVAIPAIAYKQKLATGGSGLRILRLDQAAVAVFTLDRRTGEAVARDLVDANLFPEDAVYEAIEVTSGMPYTSRGKISINSFITTKDADDVEETEVEKTDMVQSVEYKAIVERYQDEKGKLNYSLMNKDFIQFAAKSKTVATLVAEQAKVEDILNFIVKSRAAFIADKKDDLTEQQVDALIETLDEINPRSAFKELKAYIKRLLAKQQ